MFRVEPGQEVEVGARRPTSLVYGVSLAVSYTLLLALPALRDGLVTEAVEDAIVLGGVWLLAELFVLAARRREADTAASAPALPADDAPAEVGPPDAAAVSPDLMETEVLEPAKPVTTAEYVASVEIAPATEHVELTPIESHLLACIAIGLSNRQIAELLQVSQGTVRYRLTRLYRSLDVHGRAEAVDRARQLGMALPIDLRGTAP